MKRFNSFLAEQMEDFIEYRLQLGYSVRDMVNHLKIFDRYLIEKNAIWASFNPLFFLEFRSSLNYENRSKNMGLRMVKMFFNFLVRKDLIQENPLLEIAQLPKNQIVPFIFSPEETDLLIKGVIKLMRKTEQSYLGDFSAYISFLLMARCGLRISETLNLLKTNYMPEERTIYIEKTKFKKDRLIPIPKAVVAEINNLLNLRRLFDKEDNPLLLVKNDQTKLSKSYTAIRFKEVIKYINLDQPRKVIGTTNFCGPSHHSLRHTFAVNTLKRIKLQGKSPQNALPVLATYMGHSEYRYTTKYLKVLDAEHRHQMFDFSMSMHEAI
ncbi:MAG: tyrosine-type recombinase/integrase [Desulfobacula sp.]|jgi:integrase/recombinase XerD|uniref:tyrosine-type recombinase/integrase n=1 Tax=Desulfobacula sp. TaxID=2593537 RepID=UPI001DD2DCC5|nr:tyrosine-type recombinase/integrase [Desulfobacula sp.]MBT3803443.1 tyrosine-type recombinase/integrase [Desulfobacula sp.]MBT4027524.1 tyrosine-type recombinase/integrase [Desulfobacula sp.]MBT4201095.1 tyrosine-type recombinase/integrase [Desulfobacula sp.]MBT4509113.1 tyrosine-type recombinase/integrase [Desulfobacula sp.]